MIAAVFADDMPINMLTDLIANGGTSEKACQRSCQASGENAYACSNNRDHRANGSSGSRASGRAVVSTCTTGHAAERRTDFLMGVDQNDMSRTVAVRASRDLVIHISSGLVVVI